MANNQLLLDLIQNARYTGNISSIPKGAISFAKSFLKGLKEREIELQNEIESLNHELTSIENQRYYLEQMFEKDGIQIRK